MSEVVIPYRFTVRRGTAAALAAVNEVPLSGEWVLETDTRMMKVGNGTDAYNTLPYFAGGGGSGVITVSGAPTGGDGVDGDYAIDPATSTLYGPKAAGVWPAGVSLIGPAGPVSGNIDGGNSTSVYTGTGTWDGGSA